MAVVPFWTLALLNRPKSGVRPTAEALFGGLFVAAALYIMFNEGPRNWQSLWTCAAYFLFGSALWSARSVAVPEIASTAPVVLLHKLSSASRVEHEHLTVSAADDLNPV